MKKKKYSEDDFHSLNTLFFSYLWLVGWLVFMTYQRL